MAFTPLVQYKGKNDGRGPSPSIWADLPRDIQDFNVGVYFEDDFVTIPSRLTNTAEAAIGETGQYEGFASDGATVVGASDGGGAVTLTPGNAGDEAVSLRVGGAPFKINSTSYKFWFEARVKVSLITDDQSGWFIGLRENTAATVVLPILADDTLAVGENLLGFWRNSADGDALDVVSGPNNSAVPSTVIADAHTLVADTYVKVGMKFDPKDGKLRYFFDGVEHATTTTVTAGTGATQPDDVFLGPIIAGLCESGSPGTATLDWWRAAQLSIDS